MTRNAFAKPKPPPSGGLGATLDRAREFSGASLSGDTARLLAVSALSPRQGQPRKFFDEGKLSELAESIRERGVLQPLLARPQAGGYEIVFGERRYRAAQIAGLHEVPVIVRQLTDAEASIIAAVENLQRENLSVFEETQYKVTLLASALERPETEVPDHLRAMRTSPTGHVDDVRLAEEVFGHLGRESWVSFTVNKLPLLRLSEPLLGAVQRGELDYTKALLIRRAPQEKWSVLLHDAVQSGLSVSELKGRVSALRPAPEARSRRGQQTPDLQVLKQYLSAQHLNRLTASQRKRADKLLLELDTLLRSSE